MGVARSSPNLAPAGKDPRDCREQRRSELTDFAQSQFGPASTAAPLHALAQDERPVPPLPIGPRQATAADHARALSEMADTAARDSAKCKSSGAALGTQAYKQCRALLEDKMRIENDVPPDRSYAHTRGRN